MNADFHINGTVIETERLILRLLIEKDLNDFFEYASVEGVGEMAGWPHHKNIDESKAKLDKFIKEDKVFAICLKSNNKFIGTVGVERYKSEYNLTKLIGYLGREIGFVLSKDYWGQGIMPEAVNAVIDYLFNVLSLDFLVCCHYEYNTQSKRVQQKCGFIPYKEIIKKTQNDTDEKSILNILINPNKNVEL